VATEYDFAGPGVVKPHPRENWVNPDAKQVHFASGEARQIVRTDRERRTRAKRTVAQGLAGVTGLLVLLIGIAGFIPGITTGHLASNGLESNAELLGVFRVSVVGNLIHLVFGLAGLLAATRVPWAKFYLVVGGVCALAVAGCGFIVVDQPANANVIPFNRADNVLHVCLGLGMIGLGLIGVAAETRGK
jgi:hypothetical protein